MCRSIELKNVCLMQVDWARMEKLYKEADLEIVRIPIEDFNGDELTRLVLKGAQAVDEMVQV